MGLFHIFIIYYLNLEKLQFFKVVIPDIEILAMWAP